VPSSLCDSVTETKVATTSACDAAICTNEACCIPVETPTCSFRYYRLVVIGTRKASYSVTQISEFRLLQGNATTMTRTPATASSSLCGVSPVYKGVSEDGTKAHDNDVNTKWAERSGSSDCFEPGVRFGALVYDFNATYAADSYIMGTANDVIARDPVTWRIDGSADGALWITLDERENFPMSLTRKELQPRLSFSNQCDYTEGLSYCATSGFVCPSNTHHQRPDYNVRQCQGDEPELSGECTIGNCCKWNPRCESDFSCPAGSHPKSNMQGLRCPAAVCVGSHCCDGNESCAAASTTLCDTATETKRTTTTACTAEICTHEECCDVNEFCASAPSSLCNSAIETKQVTTSDCDAAICTNEECCIPVETATPTSPLQNITATASISNSQRIDAVSISVSPSFSTTRDSATDNSVDADESSGTNIPAILAGFVGFLLFMGFLAHRIRRLQHSLNLQQQRAAAGDEEPARNSRMSFSHRGSVALRMTRLDGVGDVENPLGKDGSEVRRFSAYSNARRKSEVAREDDVNRDIAAAVKKKKEKRKQRQREPREKGSMSSGADSRGVDSNAD
jgi:hypothetical protein